MKEFMAVRKPIYIAEISANYESFSFTGDMFNAFVEQHPEYKDCKYDKEQIRNGWTIRLFRECEITFVEL
jgi:hypothetical protein